MSGLLRAAEPLGIFVLALGIYLGSALLLGGLGSPDLAYYDLLADAIVKGRLWLITTEVHDLTRVGSRSYLPFPPLPALLILPWRAVAGMDRVDTVLFSVGVGAANVTLLFLMLQALTHRGWSALERRGQWWLTLLFGLGSLHWYMVLQGTVWFLAQVTAVTFVLLALLLALRRAPPWLAGVALAVAMLARPHIGLTVLLLAAIYVEARRPTRAEGARLALALLLPLAVAGAGLLAYNHARFGEWSEFGYLRQNVDEELAPDLARYGQFDLVFVPRNLHAMLLAGPTWSGGGQLPLPEVRGMSLLLTTPALLYLARARARRPVVVGAWATVLGLLVPLLTYYNTGWWQFGYRFSLDFMGPLVMLLAIALRPPLSRTFRGLVLLGVVANGFGAVWFAAVTGRL